MEAANKTDIKELILSFCILAMSGVKLIFQREAIYSYILQIYTTLFCNIIASTCHEHHNITYTWHYSYKFSSILILLKTFMCFCKSICCHQVKILTREWGHLQAHWIACIRRQPGTDPAPAGRRISSERLHPEASLGDTAPQEQLK